MELHEANPWLQFYRNETLNIVCSVWICTRSFVVEAESIEIRVSLTILYFSVSVLNRGLCEVMDHEES